MSYETSYGVALREICYTITCKPAKSIVIMIITIAGMLNNNHNSNIAR